ncbi:MAG: Holliday junction branch migration protein RuvA [Gammaproteobacteria bacterium]
MIGRLRGLLLEKRPPFLLLEVQGVGYELEAPMSTFVNLPGLQKETSLYTHLIVREDAHLLFGFISENERRLFRALIKVSGVGAKLALAILSGGPEEFVRCVQQSDATRLTRLPGIGKKTAERLIVEMRDRVAQWDEELASGVHLGRAETAAGDEVADAVAGLISLGYKPQEASRSVRAVAAKEGLSTEEIIRRALRRTLQK